MSTKKSRNTTELPQTYRSLLTVDFKKNRKFAMLSQTIFIAIALLAVLSALVFELPLTSGLNPWLTVVITLVACVLYMAAHEATHGITLRVLTGVQSSYAVRFPLLTTSSPCYLTRRSTMIAALSPCVLWGAVLFAALFLVPSEARMTVYVLLALNFAGSAGDYLEAVLAFRQPTDALLHDDGDRVQVFTR